MTESFVRQAQVVGGSQALISQADFMIAKNMAKNETRGSLVSYDRDHDAVEVFV